MTHTILNLFFGDKIIFFKHSLLEYASDLNVIVTSPVPMICLITESPSNGVLFRPSSMNKVVFPSSKLNFVDRIRSDSQSVFIRQEIS